MVITEPIAKTALLTEQDVAIAQPDVIEEQPPRVTYGFFKAALITLPVGAVIWVMIYFAIERLFELAR
jgi:hypothetical protein